MGHYDCAETGNRTITVIPDNLISIFSVPVQRKQIQVAKIIFADLFAEKFAVDQKRGNIAVTGCLFDAKGNGPVVQVRFHTVSVDADCKFCFAVRRDFIIFPWISKIRITAAGSKAVSDERDDL